MDKTGVRIHKALSDKGVMSRRKAEEAIRNGLVTVNGRKAVIGQRINTDKDIVVINGERADIDSKAGRVYIMLNKPRGYVTTTSDELGRKHVTELVEGAPVRVYPVGRLDRESEGLLLFTNDGEMANMLMHPSHRISKIYRVTVRPGVDEDQALLLASGVEIDGVKSSPARVLVLSREQGRAVLQITISEGRNRQVRRMCESVGLEVARLKRTAVGPLKLGVLKPGAWRMLTPAEVVMLRNATRGKKGGNCTDTDKKMR